MATVKQWVAWAETRIGRVVVGEGLQCGLAGVVQGPLTVTFRLRLLRPTPSNVRKVLSLGPALAQSLQVEGVRITDGAGGILVEVASPRPKSPTALDLAQATRGLTVAVGLDQWRRPVVVNLRDNPALLFVGPTRRGKTSAMKGAAFALASRNRPADVGFVVLSQKREDWTIFEPAAACYGVVSDPADVVDVLQWAAGDLLQKRAKEGGSKPAFVFVVDDLVNLLKRRPDVADPLGEIASMGGGLGLFLFVGTQDAGSKRGTGGADVEANITARVVFKSSSATTAARAAGAGGMGIDDLSNHKGDALLILDGNPTRIATAYTDDRLLAQLKAGFVFDRPWEAALRRSNDVLRNGSQGGLNGLERVGTGWNGPFYTPHEGDADRLEGGAGEERGDPFLDSTRPPNKEERGRLRALFKQLGSKEKTYRAAWGFKNGKVAAWLNEALEEDDDGEPIFNGDSGLDLSTPAGRAVFEQWKKQGLVRLGLDPTDP